MLKGYARASLEKQAIDRQLDELAAAGVSPGHLYQEKITGTKRDRPELNRLLAALQAGDTVITVELSRVSRSTKDLLEIVDLIHRKGAHFRSLNETWLDTTTPQGQLIFTIFAGLCQFERDLTAERTKSGLKAAAARGRKGGRPATKPEQVAAVEALRQAGTKIDDIAAQTGVGRSTVSRIIAAMKAREAGADS
ncbi:MAG: recombinase family protein [Oscillospiraceae bacterium]|nr:recombinase family protein [Oscillospiraceae bacterium]